MIREFIFVVLAATLGGFPALPQKQAPTKTPAKQAESPAEALNRLLVEAYDAVEKKEFERAIPLLEKYLRERPNDAAAHFQLGYAYVGLNRAAEAKEEFARAAELNPGLAAAHLNLGLLLLEDSPAEAEAALARAVELDGKHARSHYLLGLARERNGKAEAAVESYRMALALESNNVTARVALGRVLLGLGRAREAEEEFRAALEAQTELAEARLGLAESLIAQDKLSEAAPELEAYLRQRPDDHSSRGQFASVLADVGREDDALAQLDLIEKAGKSTSKLLELRAAILVRQKKFDEGLQVAARLVELEPRNAQAHARLGRLHLEKRQFAAAERQLRAALALDPKLTDSLRDLVAVYYLSEKYAEALEAQDELARRETPQAGFWFIRATCYDKLRRKPEALAAYQKFLELDNGENPDRNFQARQRVKIITRELQRK
jgi:Flp pilus assembly protein TadD